ncbi:MAG: barstar family protein [Clostridia bacterium]|nr:barstar family protein [Clostridia bacterium]
MKIIELDLTGCEYLFDIHERIRIAFDFPDWYGKNWSAFWDLLRSECDADQVIIKGTNSLSHEFDSHLNKLYEILGRNINFRQKLSLNSFSYKIID